MTNNSQRDESQGRWRALFQRLEDARITRLNAVWRVEDTAGEARPVLADPDKSVEELHPNKNPEKIPKVSAGPPDTANTSNAPASPPVPGTATPSSPSLKPAPRWVPAPGPERSGQGQARTTKAYDSMVELDYSVPRTSDLDWPIVDITSDSDRPGEAQPTTGNPSSSDLDTSGRGTKRVSFGGTVFAE